MCAKPLRLQDFSIGQPSSSTLIIYANSKFFLNYEILKSRFWVLLITGYPARGCSMYSVNIVLVFSQYLPYSWSFKILSEISLSPIYMTIFPRTWEKKWGSKVEKSSFSFPLVPVLNSLAPNVPSRPFLLVCTKKLTHIGMWVSCRIF